MLYSIVENGYSMQTPSLEDSKETVFSINYPLSATVIELHLGILVKGGLDKVHVFHQKQSQ